MDNVETELQTLGYELPHAPPPVGYYVPALKTGSFVMTSGQLPFVGKELAFAGKVGGEVTIGDGQHAARICVLNALAQIKECCGSLDAITRVVRLEGYVQSAEGFTQQPVVLNAASELLCETFGDIGKHTRIALGINEMPMNAPVQIALWVETA